MPCNVQTPSPIFVIRKDGFAELEVTIVNVLVPPIFLAAGWLGENEIVLS